MNTCTSMNVVIFHESQEEWDERKDMTFTDEVG